MFRRTGGGIGFAVERTLVEGLAVRLSSTVVAAHVGQSRAVFSDGTTGTTGRTLDAGFSLAPALELRLAF